MKQPLVSIITPVFNGEAYFRETFDNVRAQRWRNWEWIVVDDASTDGTWALLQDLARKEPRLRIRRLRANIGQAGAVRNIAMARAAGEYIAFLDADDQWEPTKLRRQVAHLIHHRDVDVVCSWIDFFGDPGRSEQWRRMDWRYDTPEVTHRQIVTQAMATSSILFRRGVYTETGGMDEDPRLVIGEDTEFGIRLVMRYRTHRIRKPLTMYRVNALGKSLSSVQLRVRQRRVLALHEIIAAKDILPPDLLKLHAALTFYNEAKNNLFHYGMPYRGLLWRSIRSGAAPAKAWVMFALCWLPAPMLRRVLEVLLAASRFGK